MVLCWHNSVYSWLTSTCADNGYWMYCLFPYRDYYKIENVIRRSEEGHVLSRMLDAPVPGKRRDEGHVLSRIVDAPVPGKRRRGRQKTRWKDCCKRDIGSVGLKVEDILDRTKCKKAILKTILAMPDEGESLGRRRRHIVDLL